MKTTNGNTLMRQLATCSRSSSVRLWLLLSLLYIATSIGFREWRLLLAAPWFPLGLLLGAVSAGRPWYKTSREVVAAVGYILFAHWTTYFVDNLLGVSFIRDGRMDFYVTLRRPYFFYAGLWAGIGSFLGSDAVLRTSRKKGKRVKDDPEETPRREGDG